MQQVEFVLQNFFIVRPNKSSAYKLKIVINHETSEQKYKDSQSKYKFKFSINDHLLEKPYGFICLLQKTNSSDNQNANYLEIGKGELDFNDIITNTKDNISTLNGVIYGTRATNFDKLIAKYGYQIVKSRFEPQKMDKINKQSFSVNRIKFKNHHPTQKLPLIKLNQSILKQTNQINAKIRKLTSTIMEQNEDQRTVQLSQTTVQPKQTINRSEFKSKESEDKQTNAYYFKINQKIQNAIIQSKLNGLRWVQIKSMQINKYLADQKNINSNTSDYLLLKIIQNTFKKLYQIIIKIKFNTNNRFLDLFFAIPIQLQTITFEISFMQTKMQLLLGTLRMGSSINKIIQLYGSTTNEEKGFMNIEILKNTPQDYNLSTYQDQLEDFNHYYRQFPDKIVNQSAIYKFTIPSINPTLSSPIRQSRSIQQLSKERFYTNTPNKNGIQRLTNIPVSLKKNKAINLGQLQKIVSTPKIKRSQTQQSAYNPLYLKINNIYLNLYDQTQDYIFLKFVTSKHSQVKQVQSGFNNFDQDKNNLVLDDLHQHQQIKILCYTAHSNQKANLLGKCSISVRSIIQSSTNQMKIFLTNHKSFIGFIILELSLYRIKNNKIRTYKRSQLLHDQPPNQQQYQLQLSSNQVLHTPNLSSKFRNQTAFNSSFIVEQQNFR